VIGAASWFATFTNGLSMQRNGFFCALPESEKKKKAAKLRGSKRPISERDDIFRENSKKQNKKHKTVRKPFAGTASEIAGG
jgi:hypothetical protein